MDHNTPREKLRSRPKVAERLGQNDVLRWKMHSELCDIKE